MAVDAALLGIPVDPTRLFHADEECLMFVDTVVDRVAEIYQRAKG